ncbi:MAG: hypothetical protein IKP64_06805 [Selenomonadaceae bacterium]|nr:hypothetical protein [Selenomonadaceae bacterium]
MNFDDVEVFLEGILTGLKARKEIDPLRQKVSELETANATLTSERDESREKCSNLQTRLDELENEQKISRQQLADTRENFERQLDEQKKNYERELSDVCNELDTASKALKVAEDTANLYRTTYAELENAYKIYLSLDEATRIDLAGIFGTGDTVTGFFSGAVQESHLAQFWDYVSCHVDDSRLAELFDFCFETFNRGFREPPYSRLVAERGSYFNDETMRRTTTSRQMGRVARVLLQGYRYSSGNVIRQSVVELA